MEKCFCGHEMTKHEWKNQWVCHRCGRTKVIREYITNADRIRSMTDEELADFIEMKQFFALARNGTDGEYYTLNWLKSEVGCE